MKAGKKAGEGVAGEHRDAIELACERVECYVQMMSMIVTHEIVPEDDREGCTLALEHGVGLQIARIMAESAMLEAQGKPEWPRKTA